MVIKSTEKLTKLITYINEHSIDIMTLSEVTDELFTRLSLFVKSVSEFSL